VAIAAVFIPRGVPPRTWLLVGAAAVIPDLDAVGRLWNAGDVEWLGGHRALTHSLAFATACGVLQGLTLRRSIPGVLSRFVACVALVLAVASHGALDALTTYGEGIRFLAPFSDARYRAPWRPLGDGIVRDSIAFAGFYFLARAVIVRRGLPLPRVLDPPFLR
jgi:inner membrane protein